MACETGPARQAAIELAFDYRGDVTLELTDGPSVTGYLANRDLTTSPPFVEIYPSNGEAKFRIDPAKIVAISFTGVDTAAGKSWDAWLKKVAEAEAAGQIAELYPAP